MRESEEPRYQKGLFPDVASVKSMDTVSELLRFLELPGPEFLSVQLEG